MWKSSTGAPPDADAPRVSVSGLTSTDSMAAYKTDDYPSQLDLLHRTFAHESMWPIWYEYPDRAVSRLDYMPFGVPVTLGGRYRGTVHRDRTGPERRLDGLDAAEIIIDDEQTLTIPEPVTQFVIQGQDREGQATAWLEFDQHDTELSDLGTLPANLKNHPVKRHR